MKVLYLENKVGGNTKFWTHFRFLCHCTVLQCTAVVRKHYVVPRPAQLTKTTKSARKRAPIDCARAKPTTIHWLIYLLKKVSHLWNYKNFFCLIWLILLFFVLSYVFQKNNASKKVGKNMINSKDWNGFFKVWKHAKQRIKKNFILDLKTLINTE